MPHWFLALLIFYSIPSVANKSAVLLIGDGMGSTVITATRMYFKGVDGKLFLDQTRHRGKLTTPSRDRVVTDSAASATAMATGQMVDNGVLSSFEKKPAVNQKLKTILEMASEQGKAVGLISNVEWTHATPAAFYAHVHSREATSQIVKSLVKSPVDLILGAGLGFLDVYHKELSSKFRISTNMDNLQCDLKKPLLGSFLAKRFPFVGDVKNQKPRKDALKKMAEFAINCLSKNKKGYFLMIESGRIDQALHHRNICNALYETKEFDEVAQFVVNRVDKKNTLVLATADHDTGGLAINGDLLRGRNIFFTQKPCWRGKLVRVHKKNRTKQTYEALRGSTDSLYPEFIPDDDYGSKRKSLAAPHTAHDVDLFAWGMGAEKVYGLHNNTFVFTLLKEALEL